MKNLSVQQIIEIHDLVVAETGGLGGVKDVGRIESAIKSVEQHVFGTELYPSILHKAAVLLRGLVCDHPFVDGNKRTAMLTTLIFLRINKITFATEESEIENFAVSVATEKLSVEAIAGWLEENTVYLD